MQALLITCHYIPLRQDMYYQQKTTKLMGMGPAPIDPGPDLVCRMAANSIAQVTRLGARPPGAELATECCSCFPSEAA